MKTDCLYKKILVFLVVNLVLVSMFRVCCETGPIFLCLYFLVPIQKKSPNRMAWKPYLSGEVTILNKSTLNKLIY